MVHRRVHDDQPAVATQHARRLAQRHVVVWRIVERGVEDDQVELPGREGQAIELRLHRDERQGVRGCLVFDIPGVRAQAIRRVGRYVHRGDPVAVHTKVYSTCDREYQALVLRQNLGEY